MEWLDSKEPNSVTYVNFGSVTTMTKHQLVEFAWGLTNSEKTFLWVIRSKWDVGMELESNDDRVEIERLARELMDGEKGKHMKKKAVEWKLLGEKATTAPNGHLTRILSK
ncbi:hypothetical protein Patl1_07564 [Pistacia atlantica]|uniref:Uncharacterized protein n=1 Tax=Pistacia atlantica TaxID=434234 RepID=A0ACC1ALK9_9ROSI|nr:hypothetical protein Patl1_07564 [Pistacia atlantica]